MSELEAVLDFQLKALKIGGYGREVEFHPERKWRGDFVWGRPAMLIVEVEGGTYSGGRHVRGEGFEKDARKYNTAALMGYTVLRFTGSQVKSGEAVDVISTYLDYFGEGENSA